MAKRQTPDSVMSRRPSSVSAKEGDATGAADLLQGRAAGQIGVVVIGLDHADETVAGECIRHHGEVTRLEDVERQFGMRQQKRAWQREHFQDARQVVR